MIAAGTKIAQLGYSAEGSQAEDVVNLAQAEVYEMSTGRVKQDYEAIGPVVHDALEQLDKLQNGDLKTGVPTGFRDIDDVTQGLQPGQMVVVAGRPAMGKSTLGIDFARAAALHHNMTSIVFSLEMSKVELAQRIISAETNIPLAAMRRADDITADRWNTLNNFWNKLQNAPLFIDDSPNMSLMEIRAKCRRLKQTNDLKLVVIDYLQLMSSGKQVEKPTAGGLGVLASAEAARQGAGSAGRGVVPAEPWARDAQRTRSRSCPTCANPARSSRTPTWCCWFIDRISTTRRTGPARQISSWRSIVTVRRRRSIWRFWAHTRSSRTCRRTTTAIKECDDG